MLVITSLGFSSLSVLKSPRPITEAKEYDSMNKRKIRSTVKDKKKKTKNYEVLGIVLFVPKPETYKQNSKRL